MSPGALPKVRGRHGHSVCLRESQRCPHTALSISVSSSQSLIENDRKLFIFQTRSNIHAHVLTIVSSLKSKRLMFILP